MSERSTSVAGRAVVAALGLVVVVASAALADRGTTSRTTYGGASASFAVLEIAVGAALLAAALLLVAEPATAVLGSLAVAGAAGWLAPVWVGWDVGPSALRWVGLVLAPLLPAVVLALVVHAPPSGARAGRRLVLASVAISAAAAVALLLVRDPLRDLYCWSDCTVPSPLGYDDTGLTRALTRLVFGLGAAGGVLAAAVGGVQLARATAVTRRGSGIVFGAAALAGLALAAYAVALVAEPREAPGRPLYEWLFVGRALALLALAAGLAWVALRPRLVRGLVTRLAVDLERSTAEGGLGCVLAGVLGDPGLRLGYPIGPGDRIVDAAGRPLELDPERRVTELVDEQGVVALVESAGTSAVALERELGPAARLAVGNERLRAEALARLADVTGSRARIVETADAARRRMERDLHDGAQQRLLAVTYDLRVALTIAESAAGERAATPLRVALDRAVSASRELRDLAHGIFPAELTASGLEAALESLADLRPLRLAIALPPGRRYRPEVETAAYATVAELAEEGTPLDVELSERDGAVHLAVEADVDWRARLVRIEDRVGAAGGSVDVSRGRLEAKLPVALSA